MYVLEYVCMSKPLRATTQLNRRPSKREINSVISIFEIHKIYTFLHRSTLNISIATDHLEAPLRPRFRRPCLRPRLRHGLRLRDVEGPHEHGTLPEREHDLLFRTQRWVVEFWQIFEWTCRRSCRGTVVLTVMHFCVNFSVVNFQETVQDMWANICTSSTKIPR